MSKSLASPRVRVADDLAADEYAYEQGWTDGLPIVAPTPERVLEFLEYAGFEPDQEIAHYEIRNRFITAEKIAINAVMAGCEPAYFPVVTAAIEAVTDHAFHMNHLASTSSPWPIFIVNGPVIQQLGLNGGTYVQGPGNAVNATIGRAVSLTLSNCMEAHVGGVQQGVLGIPSRVGGMVIAEREDLGWEPLSVLRGLPAGTSAITAIPHVMGGPQQIVAYPPEFFPNARAVASLIIEQLAEYNSVSLDGTHALLISPPMLRRFQAEGWSKADLHEYLLDHARISFAKTKRKHGTGGFSRTAPVQRLPNGEPLVDPGDYQKYSYIGIGREGKSDPVPPAPDDHPRRQSDFLIAVAGSDEGEAYACLGQCYPLKPGAVTKVIRDPAGL